MTNAAGERWDPEDPAAGITFGFFGSIRRDKGLWELLQAWEEGQLGTVSARLVVVGRPAEPMAEERAWLERSGGRQVFAHLAQVDHDVLLALMDRVDVVVLPYRTGSQSGILALGVSRARACLVAAVGDLRSAVPEHRWGVLSFEHYGELPEKLRTLAGMDRATVRRLGQELNTFADAAGVERRIRSAYRDIVNGRASGSAEESP